MPAAAGRSGPDEIAEANAGVERLVRKERKRLWDFIRRRIRSEADAEDILQDVLTQLVLATDPAEPIENLTSWLFTVAKNRIIDWYRRRKQIHPPGEGDDDRFPGGDFFFDPDPGPDELTADSILRAEIDDALDELPDEQRSVFIMHEFDGKSFKEIAGETGEPVSTLLSRKRYAVLYLRERLRDLYDEFQTL